MAPRCKFHVNDCFLPGDDLGMREVPPEKIATNDKIDFESVMDSERGFTSEGKQGADYAKSSYAGSWPVLAIVQASRRTGSRAHALLF